MTVEHIVITIIFFFLSICEIFTCPEYIGLTTTTNVIWNSFIRNALASSYDIEGGDSGADHADRIAKWKRCIGSYMAANHMEWSWTRCHWNPTNQSFRSLWKGYFEAATKKGSQSLKKVSLERTLLKLPASNRMSILGPMLTRRGIFMESFQKNFTIYIYINYFWIRIYRSSLHH